MNWLFYIGGFNFLMIAVAKENNWKKEDARENKLKIVIDFFDFN